MKNLIALGLLMAGSATAQTAKVVDLSSSPDQRIAALEQMLVQKGKTQLEMQQHIDSLQQELNELRGLNETQEHRLNQILQRQRELYQEVDKLLTKLNAAVVTPTNEVVDVTNPTAGAPLSESGAYEFALNLALKDKKFDEAIEKFKAYQTQYPESSYLSNVHYWLGQLYITKGNAAEAKIQFEALVNNFPESIKRGDALVKLAKIAQDENALDKAKALYQQTIKEYADSSAAQIAKTRLKGLR
ncbi:tol-pal system protein YbgF [Psychrobium sp. MM17-31]|uniref:tol-pal system protein YbgF n=1 Tax=Psychrobium sp. MM17-31 TaxID=2917758 RepID=UPI001EF4B83D|nr:tol-pal system protein YbgF [Psychrobium sp. MM17-31]MCG7531505.1 tol-pal system protein YbgF [Psychrobium sp. MM17-31]